MKEKIVKTMLIVSLIMAMTLVGVITLGKNLVIIENKSSKEQISHAKATEQSGLVMETTEKLTVELKGISGGEVLKEGQEVYEGQGITYEINLTNDSQETLSNINVKAIHTNAIYYDALPEHFSFAGTEEEITKIKENPELTEKVSNIEKIEPGETKQIKYQISVKEVEEENQTTKGDIQIQIDGTEELQIETPTCKIMSAELKATFHSVYQEEIDIFSEQYYPVEFRVQNISDNNIENVIIEAELPDELDFSIENIYLGNENEGDDEDDEDYDYDPTEEEEYEDEEGEGYQGDNEEIKYELIDYKDKILRLKIPVIGANETVSIEAQLTANEIAYDQVTVDTNLHFKAIVDDKTYTSNDLYRTIHQGKPSIEIEQTANRENNETIEPESVNRILDKSLKVLI